MEIEPDILLVTMPDGAKSCNLFCLLLIAIIFKHFPPVGYLCFI